MVLFMGVLSGVLWFAFDRVTQHIYLEQAQNRTNVIVDGLKDSSHEVWDAFLAGRATPQDLETLGVIFKESVEQQKLISLKVYDLKGVVIYDVFPDKIGMIETAPSLRYVILNNQATLLRKNAADGSIAYEIYIPHTDRDGNLRAIFELYEEVSYLDTLLLETAIPAIAVPVVLLMVLMFVLGVLVLRAQTDIDQRTEAIGELSRRLESFVSASALEAAKNAGNASVIPSRKIVCTLFHSDVRDFTSFAENNQPERVVYFLNDLMSIQVRVVTHFGGDVDKMIGDALLVRFEGEEAEQRAINAAKSILDIVQRASLARGVGIGIFTGQVISGAIGPESRRDFTVIGDSVNMSARLCSHANSGEIIADAATVRAAEAKGFGPTENLQVKGHAEPVAVQRWNIEQMAKKG
ncbi:MAG: hypothetical protein A2516_04785 [Alphaproteobacteria bacterium RIFOXYD12_FULL_60_8]|nr:MAG: hypothetical protein A2516_04785 [Alphaproteobacteria bacterium RIFOXYD12_FULL_60_8]